MAQKKKKLTVHILTHSSRNISHTNPILLFFQPFRIKHIKKLKNIHEHYEHNFQQHNFTRKNQIGPAPFSTEPKPVHHISTNTSVQIRIGPDL